MSTITAYCCLYVWYMYYLSLVVVVCTFVPCIFYPSLLLSVHLLHMSDIIVFCWTHISSMWRTSLPVLVCTLVPCDIYHCRLLPVPLLHMSDIIVCYILYICLVTGVYVCCWMYICSIWWILLPVVVSTFVPCVRYNCLFFSVVATCSAVATTVAATRVVMDLISYLGEFEILTWA